LVGPPLAASGLVGKRAATASRDCTVKLWDAVSGRLLRTIAAPLDRDDNWYLNRVASVAFSSDGRRLASVGDCDVVKLWDTASGQELLTVRQPGVSLAGGPSEIHGLAFDPEGQRLAVTNGAALTIWDARTLTPERELEREALGVLDLLLDRPLTDTEVLEEIRRLSPLGESVRQQALTLAGRLHRDPELLERTAWEVVHRPDRPPASYDWARRQAEVACRFAPENGVFANTLGVAQYRLGLYEGALATLTRSDRLNAARPEGALATDVAFLAMTQHRLDHKDQARANLERLRQLMKKPEYADNVQVQGFLREAESLLEMLGP
jgi:hypothetical protein